METFPGDFVVSVNLVFVLSLLPDFVIYQTSRGGVYERLTLLTPSAFLTCRDSDAQSV